MSKTINNERWFTNIEIDDYLSNPDNSIAHVDDQADVLATIGEELRSGKDCTQGLEAALYDDLFEGEISLELYEETMDLIDIVEAVEKGHILYG